MGLVILILGLLLIACDSPGSETANKPKSTKAEITSFNFGSIIGVWSADRKTLRFTFTKGTDVKNLPVKVVGLSAGATILPDPETAKDYIKPILFTITSENGKHRKTFTVSVTVLDQINDKAEITSFSFGVGNEDVKIDPTAKTITVKLPYGTPIDKLTASYTLSAGASITPDPKTPFNYAGSQTFTVTAEDSTTKKTYTIKVKVLPKKPSTKAKITTFSLGNDANDTVKIDHSKGEITVGLQYTAEKTDITRLKATLTLSDEARITSAFDPTSKEADYSQTYQTPKVVIISAEDGQTTQTYKIKVQIKVPDVAKNSDGSLDTTDRNNVVYGEIKRMGGKTDEEFTGDLNHLDMSAVSNMKNLFSGITERSNHYYNKYANYAKQFNGTISKWEVGNVKYMISMFYGASSFNGNISKWEVGNVKYMSIMFADTRKFNGNISKWKVGNVKSMRAMFYNALGFNQDLSDWNVSSVLDDTDFAVGATAYKKPKPKFN